jgi:hypothetical protein
MTIALVIAGGLAGFFLLVCTWWGAWWLLDRFSLGGPFWLALCVAGWIFVWPVMLAASAIVGLIGFVRLASRRRIVWEA